jgi:stringent starvation protein B
MSVPSRRPYLIRAIYDWTLDARLTPYLLVATDQPGVIVPPGYARDNRIALDISPVAVRDLDLQHDPIYFSARFGGVSCDLWIPSGAVLAIYARENGEGLLFGEPEPTPIPGPGASDGRPPTDTPPSGPKPSGRPKLRVVK